MDWYVWTHHPILVGERPTDVKEALLTGVRRQHPEAEFISYEKGVATFSLNGRLFTAHLGGGSTARVPAALTTET